MEIKKETVNTLISCHLDLPSQMCKNINMSTYEQENTKQNIIAMIENWRELNWK